MSNQQESQQQEERGIVTRVIEQVDAREAIVLIDTLTRLSTEIEKLKWSCELRVRIN
jgi:hypothetical protein